MAAITLNGITQNSSLEKHITDEEFNSIASEYYARPDISEVHRQMKSIHNGGVRMNLVYDYYIKEVMSKAIGTRASWSIWDGIHNRQIMEYFAAKVDKNKKVFPDSCSLARKIETAFRLCGIRYCVKLPNFPLKTARDIISRYNVNGNYYDYSCGWAARMLGALSSSVNYFGTDPNNELVDRLNEVADEYRRINCTSTTVDIRCQGSQRFIPEWENRMGMAFSSPPYYSLEDYQIGEEQSYRKGMTYREWADSYITPTVSNISRYLIPGGHFLFNVKSFRDYTTNEIYPLERDFIGASLRNGFEYVEKFPLINRKRCHGNANEYKASGGNMMMSDSSENIYVFRKPR